MERSVRYQQEEGLPRDMIIDGLYVCPTFNEDDYRSALAYEPTADDVFVCTYAKCGTTWVQNIAYQLLNAGQTPTLENDMNHVSAFLEFRGGAFVRSLPPPRLIKTHLPRALVPQSPRAKYMVTVRNPKDCLVSFYHHYVGWKMYEWKEGRMDAFFELFMSGRVDFGDYFEHLRGWLPQLDEPNVLLVKYEDMLDDLPAAVRRIGRFLGGAAERVLTDDAFLETVVRQSSFGEMAKDQGRFFADQLRHLDKVPFIRKGLKNDWRSALSAAQSEAVDRRFEERLRGTVAEHWWKDVM